MEMVQPLRDRTKIEEIKQLLSVNKRDFLMFVLGINCGLRISDILRMEIGDVIDRSGRPKKYYELREKKTNKYKRFIFAENVQAAILSYLNGYIGNYDRPLFLSRKSGANGHSKPLTRQQAYNILNDAARNVGVDDNIGTHSLRKTFGYFAYKAGTDIVLLQQIFNHTSPSVTLRYIGILQDDMDKVIINLNL
ncbi:tyrosine-type recombinase/integrase [Paenibacillus alba]|uniref:tyrosine-type recombinase/integrase n=1 Tax=Paenibacillus alba TaxID=1197127 RepID=UPI001565CBDF|nr:tyrosine-type recombinase/integrase [Paenibacillus alba]NQX66664.1 tyrosine-type recombinase/integrase [Paenibacillus alba]